MRGLIGVFGWILAEIAAFVVVGGWVGVVGTLAIVLGTGVAGVMVLRRQGVRLVARPTELAQSGLIAIGAVLLILPGFLTDLAGLALMVPVVRRVVVRGIGARFVVRQTPAAGDVVEGTAVEIGHDALRPPSGWTKP